MNKSNINHSEICKKYIENDGLLEGFDNNLINILNKYNDKPLIVSGGAENHKDFVNTFKNHNVSAISASSLYFFNKTTPNDIKKVLNNENIPVRIL